MEADTSRGIAADLSDASPGDRYISMPATQAPQ